MNHSPICIYPGCDEIALKHFAVCQGHYSWATENKQKHNRRQSDQPEPREVTPSIEYKPIEEPLTMAQRYPKYYKAIPLGLKELDTYAVNMMFPVDDPTGCILHARKKLLVPGTRTGGKSMVDDIREARDTLSRWLELQTGV